MNKTLYINIAVFYMTLDCVRPTKFSLIQTIHCNVGLKCFFIHLLLLLYIFISFIVYKVV